MEKFNEALNYLGSHAMADWFVRLDGTQKAVFLSNVGIVFLFAAIILVLLRKRVKVMTRISPEYLSELADHVGDKLLADATANRISGKDYVWLCRELGQKLPDLRGTQYTKKAQKAMKNARLKIDIAGRVKALRAWVPINLFNWQQKAKEADQGHDLAAIKKALETLAESNKAVSRDAKAAKAAPGDAAAEAQKLEKYSRRKPDAA